GQNSSSSSSRAVITGTDSKADKYHTVSDLRGNPIDVSRIGSDPQFMASVMAMQYIRLGRRRGPI
ncbi:hypothetical protein A4X03_0g9217, partial [Tilletia caries]